MCLGLSGTTGEVATEVHTFAYMRTPPPFAGVIELLEQLTGASIKDEAAIILFLIWDKYKSPLVQLSGLFVLLKGI